MLVRDLIEALSALEPDMLVVIPCYHGGYDGAKSVNLGRAILNTNGPWNGEHSEATDDTPDATGVIVIDY